MFGRSVRVLACAFFMLAGAVHAESGSREFRAAAGGTLILNLRAGGTAEITGTGGSSVTVQYDMTCTPRCDIGFAETGKGLEVTTEYAEHGNGQRSHVDLRIEVPSRFDVELDSVGGGLSIDGVEGEFSGKTMGGKLTLTDVRGEAHLTTMGGNITLKDSELDGSLKTMGGEVLFENVVGDVEGSSMGGDVRFKNVQRRNGRIGSPPRLNAEGEEINSDTVLISTMGGAIDVDDAPEGADVHTMGGNITIRDARRFVRAKTMGGDIRIDSVDGSVDATTMGGDIDATVTGSGGPVTLISMSGDIDLNVPSGFGMNLELEIAFTRNSRKDYQISAPGGLPTTVTPEWEYDHGSPRKFIRMSGAVNGGGPVVKIHTVNGNITVK